MRQQKSLSGLMRRVAAFAGGAVLLQVSACTIDDALLTDLTNLALEAFITALTGTA